MLKKQVFSWRGPNKSCYEASNITNFIKGILLNKHNCAHRSFLHFISSLISIMLKNQDLYGFDGPWSRNLISCSLDIFYNHSVPTTDLRPAVVSYWRKDVYWTLINRWGWSLTRQSGVARSTGCPGMTSPLINPYKPDVLFMGDRQTK